MTWSDHFHGPPLFFPPPIDVSDLSLSVRFVSITTTNTTTANCLCQCIKRWWTERGEKKGKESKINKKTTCFFFSFLRLHVVASGRCIGWRNEEERDGRGVDVTLFPGRPGWRRNRHYSSSTTLMLLVVVAVVVVVLAKRVGPFSLLPIRGKGARLDGKFPIHPSCRAGNCGLVLYDDDRRRRHFPCPFHLTSSFTIAPRQLLLFRGCLTSARASLRIFSSSSVRHAQQQQQQ